MAVTKEGPAIRDAEGSNAVVMFYALVWMWDQSTSTTFHVEIFTDNCLSTSQPAESTCTPPKRWAQDKCEHILSIACLLGLQSFIGLPQLTKSPPPKLVHRALEKHNKIVCSVSVFIHSTAFVEIESQEICTRNLHEVYVHCSGRLRIKRKPAGCECKDFFHPLLVSVEYLLGGKFLERSHAFSWPFSKTDWLVGTSKIVD